MRDAIRGVAVGLVLCLGAPPAFAWGCDEEPPGEETPIEIPPVLTLKDWDGKNPYSEYVEFPSTVVTKLEAGELYVYGVDPDKDSLVFIYRLASEDELRKLMGDKPRGGIVVFPLESDVIGLIQRPVPNPTPPGKPDPFTRTKKALSLVQTALAQLGKLP
jgi:hypothetical protein